MNVFNIERFATEDGPGIRTVVFLKGCSLECLWCSNPESQQSDPQILFKSVACIDCGKCIEVCPKNCIENKIGYGYITDMTHCNLCGECVKNCYSEARVIMGEEYSIERLYKEIMRDRLYYKKSGGGITFSGGEPLLQIDDICKLSAMINRLEASILIETCGHVSLDNVKKAVRCTDIFFYDFKHIDSGAHERLTGFGNEQIIENLKWLDKESDVEISIRYPYIPGYNDDIRDVRLFLEFVSGLKRVKEVWFLPYHRLGAVKYQGLGRSYPLAEVNPLRVKDVEFLNEFRDVYGLDIHIA